MPESSYDTWRLEKAWLWSSISKSGVQFKRQELDRIRKERRTREPRSKKQTKNEGEMETTPSRM